jgi:hypothetical protein
VTLRNHASNLHKQVRVMHEHQIEVVRRAFEQDPIDRGNRLMLRRSLAYIHSDAGDEYLAAGQYGRALWHLARTVLLWPFDYRYHTMLARALIKPVTARTSGA